MSRAGSSPVRPRWEKRRLDLAKPPPQRPIRQSHQPDRVGSFYDEQDAMTDDDALRHQTAEQQFRSLLARADALEDAGNRPLAAQLRTDAVALQQAELQRQHAIVETRTELEMLQGKLNRLIERHPSAFTLEELARVSVPARPLIERLAQLKGRAAILERSAA